MVLDVRNTSHAELVTDLDEAASGLGTFHHLIAVHQWDWNLTLHSDGTITARGPDGARILRSHGPPNRT